MYALKMIRIAHFLINYFTRITRNITFEATDGEQ